MSRSYAFNTQSGERATLDQVDMDLCHTYGYDYSTTDYCPRFDTLVTIGFAVLFWAGRVRYPYNGYQVDSNLLNAYLDSYEGREDYQCLTPLVPMLHQYLAGAKNGYTFEAWG